MHMDKVNVLRRYGLFDAKVPRYTSYPPANRFEADQGAQHQRQWLGAVPQDKPVSIYIHIPFCRRLCWFCACRTQGTKTLAPVESYVTVLRKEIATIADTYLGSDMPMARLHLGGGTPTLLSAEIMNSLLADVFARFAPTKDFEFSVEIDPTEASGEVLDALATWGMNRASIGVQDFAPKVQAAIGREQSIAQTQGIIDQLRQIGVQSLNVDLLYGLPFQTVSGLLRTLDQVIALGPDRVALYGYAHVPHVSKRQVMIPDAALPDTQTRFDMSQAAGTHLTGAGYETLGIDHFARASDSLTQAARAGTMTRNFQGYTDDCCATLIGFGASAISKFPQGYAQNAVATSGYARLVQGGGLAGARGFSLSQEDKFVAAMIDAIMCQHKLTAPDILHHFPDHAADFDFALADLLRTFPDILARCPGGVALKPDFTAAARLIAARLDAALSGDHIHSLAI